MASQPAEIFKALGVETRLRIIELLKQKGPLGVNELSEVLNITPSAVSQHLKVLKHAGLVRNERRGYWIPYEIDPVAMEHCRELLIEVCTCGCRGTGKFRDAQISQADDQVALLRKYERELQQELDEVRARIEEISEDT